MTAVPYWASDDGDVQLHLGDCLDVLRTLPADSVDAIVTDPPAGVAFMSKTWDTYGSRARFVEWLTERLTGALRLLKPGGHALVWSLPRTSHWTAWAIEDAGFEVRDCVLHMFGSGFPKSRNVSADIDRMAGAEREVVGKYRHPGREPEWSDYPSTTGEKVTQAAYGDFGPNPRVITAPATEDAARWDGWGTALKPGQEMWWLARKPLEAGSVAGNVLRWGTGALNIDACKVAHASAADRAESEGKNRHADFGSGPRDNHVFGSDERDRADQGNYDGSAGRWPTNLVFTHSAACEPAGTRRVKTGSPGTYTRSTIVENRVYGASNERLVQHGHADADGLEEVAVWVCAADCPAGELDRQSGSLTSSLRGKNYDTAATNQVYSDLIRSRANPGNTYGDTGGASRFYPVFKYQAKAPASERPRLEDGTAHETVKPLGFISWAVRLVTPPGGTVLDMFAGSGVTGEAAIVEGFRCILVDQDPKSAELTRKRLGKPIQPVMFGL